MKSPIITAIIFIAFVALIAGAGRATSAGYHCHWIRVGESRVCQ